MPGVILPLKVKLAGMLVLICWGRVLALLVKIAQVRKTLDSRRRGNDAWLNRLSAMCELNSSHKEVGGYGSMVEPQPSKLMMRVRFPLPAPVWGLMIRSVFWLLLEARLG